MATTITPMPTPFFRAECDETGHLVLFTAFGNFIDLSFLLVQAMSTNETICAAVQAACAFVTDKPEEFEELRQQFANLIEQSRSPLSPQPHPEA